MKEVTSAGIIVYRNEGIKREYLFLTREPKSRGWLDLPKGHVEKDENELETAKRETKEEAGVEPHIDPHFKYEVTYFYVAKGEESGENSHGENHFNREVDAQYVKKDERVHKKVVFFLGRVVEDVKVKVSSEHTGFKWLSFNEAIKELKFKDQQVLITAADEYLKKHDELRELNREYEKLPSQQKEWGLSRTLVPGEGPLNAQVMFVGQAPGRNEDIERRPFIGMAGKLLDQMIHRAGLLRKDVYITSVVQFFPPENRLPTDEEAALCMPFLERQIKLIKPKVLVVLGSFSATNVAGIGTVMKTHGTYKHLQKYGCDVFVTLHPAAAVRIKANVPTIEKDFDKLRSILSSEPSRQKGLGEF